MNSSLRKKTLAVIVICLVMLMSLSVVMGSNEYFVENGLNNIADGMMHHSVAVRRRHCGSLPMQ